MEAFFISKVGFSRTYTFHNSFLWEFCPRGPGESWGSLLSKDLAAGHKPRRLPRRPGSGGGGFILPTFPPPSQGQFLGGSGTQGGGRVGNYCTSLCCLLTTAAEYNFHSKCAHTTGSPGAQWYVERPLQEHSSYASHGVHCAPGTSWGSVNTEANGE